MARATQESSAARGLELPGRRGCGRGHGRWRRYRRPRRPVPRKAGELDEDKDPRKADPHDHHHQAGEAEVEPAPAVVQRRRPRQRSRSRSEAGQLASGRAEPEPSFSASRETLPCRCRRACILFSRCCTRRTYQPPPLSLGVDAGGLRRALARVVQAVLQRRLCGAQQRAPLPQLALHRQRAALQRGRHPGQLLSERLLGEGAEEGGGEQTQGAGGVASPVLPGVGPRCASWAPLQHTSACSRFLRVHCLHAPPGAAPPTCRLACVCSLDCAACEGRPRPGGGRPAAGPAGAAAAPAAPAGVLMAASPAAAAPGAEAPSAGGSAALLAPLAAAGPAASAAAAGGSVGTLSGMAGSSGPLHAGKMPRSQLAVQLHSNPAQQAPAPRPACPSPRAAVLRRLRLRQRCRAGCCCSQVGLTQLARHCLHMPPVLCQQVAVDPAGNKDRACTLRYPAPTLNPSLPAQPRRPSASQSAPAIGSGDQLLELLLQRLHILRAGRGGAVGGPGVAARGGARRCPNSRGGTGGWSSTP